MRVSLISFLMLIGFSIHAQIVNIPDPNFKLALLNYNPRIDVNFDNEIQVSEAQAVEDVIVLNKNISDFTGIQAFTNLEYLNCSENQLTSLDVSGLTKLQTVICTQNLLTVLNLTGCNDLDRLDFRNNSLQALNLTSFSNLRTLWCGNETGPVINEIIAEGLPRLQSFAVIGELGLVNLKNCDSLNYVSTFTLPALVETLDVSGSPRLESLQSFPAENIFAMNCPGLHRFISYVTMLQRFEFTGSNNLEEVIIQGATMPALDLSACTNLKKLHWYYPFTTPRHLNIKNGSLLEELALWQGDGLNICADDFEIDTVLTMLYPEVAAISSTCSFFPGGNFNTIKGKAPLDVNSNGCDVSDAGLNQVAIRLDDGTNQITRYTYVNGDYRHYPYAGVFTITPYFPYPYFNVTPVTTTINFDTANNLIDSANFCIAPNGIHNDVDITILPAWPARPGFSTMYQIVFRNKGTTIQSGAVQINYDNGKINFISASANPDNQSAGQLGWNYINLQPLERRVINLTLNLLPPPVNNVGDSLIYLANISPLTGDETTNDNSFVLPQQVVGSYDPNDKTCLQGNALSVADINEPLDYLIRFQNLGTDTAYNVVILDTLSNEFDWNSFEITSTSHPCDIELKNNRLRFYFQDIKLPYAAINEPASQGFVAFKIKAKGDFMIGDLLENKASIYFDFNLPVVTNTATTVIAEPAGPVPVKLEYFSLRNKTSGNELTWKIATEDVNTNFSLERSGDGIHFTSIKNISANRDRCQVPFNFTDDKPLAGTNYYRLKITDADNKSFFSKTLQTGKTTSGVELIAVTNDPAHSNLYLNASEPQSVHVKIIAADGKHVLSQQRKLQAGGNTLTFETLGLAKGIYNIIVYTETEILTKRFIR